MSNYKNASTEAQKILFAYIKERMKEKAITRDQIAEIIGVNKATVSRWFNFSNPMPLDAYLQICGILELRPYLVPSEMDDNEMNRIHFN